MTGNSPSPAASSFLTYLATILTICFLTILCFTILSFKSFHSPPLQLSVTSFSSSSDYISNSTLSPPIPPFSLPMPPFSAPTRNECVTTVPVSQSSTNNTNNNNNTKPPPAAEEEVYKDWEVFRLNYEHMENNLKIYIYPDGDKEAYFQHPPDKLTGKYASENYFFKNIRESRFRTEDPEQADLFFIPISSLKLRSLGYEYEKIAGIVKKYVQGLIDKYPYWNRTLGADHFFVTCHDVGVRATLKVPFLMKNTIRVVCSPSYKIGFVPHKDVAMPQVQLPFVLPAPPLRNDMKNRKTLGFWAGKLNSGIRNVLAQVWQNDKELDISNGHISKEAGPREYLKRFLRAKYCICPGGSQVNSARLGDSIHYGCVPVILADYYDLPFNDILDWQKITVVLRVSDVYQLKKILKAIPNHVYVSLHNNVAKVRRHFEWNTPPIKYDAFHMIMYDLWLRRSVIRY